MTTMTDATSNVYADKPLFADPVARETSWEPTPEPRFDFLGKSMHVVSADRIIYRLDPLRQAGFAVVAAVVVLLFATTVRQVYSVWQSGGDLGAGKLWLPVLAAGAGLIAVTAAAVRHRRPIVLDKEQGTLLHPYAMPSRKPVSVPLSSIHALQLLSYRRQSAGESSHGLQLIAVLQSGDRVLLARYGSSETMREEAASLGRWLDVPVWDSIRHEL